jgi:endonuclease/exonuclease/phosphatase family metal-dependent hydrolase
MLSLPLLKRLVRLFLFFLMGSAYAEGLNLSRILFWNVEGADGVKPYHDLRFPTLRRYLDQETIDVLIVAEHDLESDFDEELTQLRQEFPYSWAVPNNEDSPRYGFRIFSRVEPVDTKFEVGQVGVLENEANEDLTSLLNFYNGENFYDRPYIRLSFGGGDSGKLHVLPVHLAMPWIRHEHRSVEWLRKKGFPKIAAVLSAKIEVVMRILFDKRSHTIQQLSNHLRKADFDPGIRASDSLVFLGDHNVPTNLLSLPTPARATYSSRGFRQAPTHPRSLRYSWPHKDAKVPNLLPKMDLDQVYTRGFHSGLRRTVLTTIRGSDHYPILVECQTSLQGPVARRQNLDLLRF